MNNNQDPNQQQNYQQQGYYQQPQYPYQQPPQYQQPYYQQQQPKKDMSAGKFILLIGGLLVLLLIVLVVTDRAGVNPYTNGALDDNKAAVNEKDKELLNLNIIKTSTAKASGIFKPDDGNIYYFIDFELENNTEEEMAYIQSMFSLTTPNGVTMEYATTDIAWNDIKSVKPNGKLKNTIAFEVPEDERGEYTLVYETYVDNQKGTAKIVRK